MPVSDSFEFENSKIYIWNIAESLFELESNILSQLSENDRLKYPDFKNETRKKQWLSVRCLLKFYGIDTEILYDEFGKPFLKNSFLGISHCENFAAIIISETKNVSIDIETINSRVQKIKNKFLSEKELNNFETENDKIATLLWSAKESVFKYYGKKNLPFIDGIKILESEIYETGFLNILLFNEKKLKVNYKFLDNIVLSFIS